MRARNEAHRRIHCIRPGSSLLPATTAIAGSAERANSKTWLGSALILCAAVSFGVITTMGRLAYEGGSNPLTVVLLRHCTFVAIVGALLMLLRRSLRLTRGAVIASLWMALTLAMMSLGYLGSVAFIPVNLAALIFYSFPLLVGVIAVMAGHERMTIVKSAALLAAFVGLALALGPGLDSLDLRGIACALTAALGMGITVSFCGAAMRGQDTLVMTFYTNLWLLIALAIHMTASGKFMLPATALGGIGAAGVCLCYVVAFLSWFLAARLISPVRLAALLNIEPLVTIFAAWLLLGERLAPLQLFGACFVLGSVIAVSASGIRQASAPVTAGSRQTQS
jgi:drug/metabolite transporter (DMT)-like permease